MIFRRDGNASGVPAVHREMTNNASGKSARPGSSVPSSGGGGERVLAAAQSNRHADRAVKLPAMTGAAEVRGGFARRHRSANADANADADEQTPPVPSPLWDQASAVNVKLIYAALLTSLAVPPAAFVGFGFAWLARRRSPAAWLHSHYTYQVRTFWIGLGANVMAWALSFLGVGLLLYPLIAVWLVARCVHGLIRVTHHEDIDHPEGYFV